MSESSKMGEEICLYYPDGEVYGSGNTADGKRTGNWTFYYRNGKVGAQGLFLNCKMVGEWKSYYDNGKLCTKEVYNLEGLKHGKRELYFRSGELFQSQLFENGKEFGERLTYYPSGVLKSRAFIISDVIEGPFFEYHENAIRKTIGIYQNGGKKVGVWKYFYCTGDLQKQEIYLKEEKKVEILYSAEGYMLKKVTYSKPENSECKEEVQEWEFYHKNGCLKTKGKYYGGRYRGLWENFYEDERIKERRIYSDRKLCGLYQTFDRNGVLNEEGKFEFCKKEKKWNFYPRSRDLRVLCA